jgi:hypothetical protein
MRKALFTVLMSAAMTTAVPNLLRAQDHRYYDRDHKDYHEWNEGEGRAYRHWLVEERHHKYVDWAHASRALQRDYWRWRHDHQDWH